MIIKDIWNGKSITRAYLNQRLKTETLQGKTIDIGGGKNADYISFMKKTDDCELVTFDIKSGATVDFETDRLPAEDGTYDTVLFLNVMEHIFNYQHIANEVVRITKPGGQLIVFVPFLMWYHPDHSDFFRYTDEALEKIFRTAGIDEISIQAIGGGPFIAATHMFVSYTPRLLRPLFFGPFLFLDKLYFLFKRKHGVTHQLGYFFVAKKNL